ncbi:HD-GYP domain-containing protein [Paenibacillus gorillae]|uniref:HD-GYP domain-containing protein n=1 Tax=Paenibacillus gorillae TaxID=1243662 RepID=UPI00069385E7|nr:HD domain-containing protein [Paenibacillus gorillae]
MRLVPLSQCQPGMRLAKKIFSGDGLVLLGENVELTSRLITRLEQCGIFYLFIVDPRTEDIVMPELIGEETMRHALKEIRTNFRYMMDRPKRKKGVTYPYIAQPFKQMMSNIIDDLSSHQDAMIMLMNMGTVDDYLYQHSLNVCVYTTLLGTAYGYTREELMTLGMGALLHDIGKTQISMNVLKKAGYSSRPKNSA